MWRVSSERELLLPFGFPNGPEKKRTLSLPLAQPLHSPPRSVRQSIGHLLVIDDDPVIQDLMRSFLTREGYTVTVAIAGRKASCAPANLSRT